MKQSPHSSDRRPRQPAIVAVALTATALLVAGCGRQSILSPRSPQAHDIRTLWWWMLGVASVVFFGAVGMLAMAYVRRHERGLPLIGDREPVAQGLVLVFGIAIPLVVLVALFGVSDVYLVGKTGPPPPRDTAMTIDVIGHQWWWEIRYPGTDAVTANEIHIPVNTRVNVVATTADVIHSFWVPQLGRKIDEIPGRFNRVLLEADRVGVYRGQCSQFCGFQHAHMALLVVAQRMSAFRTWLANMSRPVIPPRAGVQRLGYQLFMTSQCASCHQLRGTSAQGLVGPDLTHLAGRATLAADTIPNNLHYLESWIANPQAIKPGDRMPDLGLPRSEVDEIAIYLESLR